MTPLPSEQAEKKDKKRSNFHKIGIAPDPIKYYVDIVITCHPKTRKCSNGKRITGNLQYLLMDALSGREKLLEKKLKTRIQFFSQVK